MRRWERAEEVRESAEEEARGASGAAEAGSQAQGMPADAALSIEEKLASKRQIFAPREAFKCAAAAPSRLHLFCAKASPSSRSPLPQYTQRTAAYVACVCHMRCLTQAQCATPVCISKQGLWWPVT